MFSSLKQLFITFLSILGIALVLFIIGIIIPSVFLIIFSIIIIIVDVCGVIFLKNQAEIKQEEKFKEQLCVEIKSKNKTSIKDLAENFAKEESDIRRLVFESFKEGKMAGYTLKGEDIVSVQEIVNEGRDSELVNCSGCGASFVGNGKFKQCPYCGKISD